MHPLAETHDILVLASALLSLVDEQGDNLTNAGTANKPDVDGE